MERAGVCVWSSLASQRPWARNAAGKVNRCQIRQGGGCASGFLF